MNNILLKYLNNNLCVTLPNHKQSSSDCLKLSNFLSEYLTDYEKLEVLRNLGVLSLIEENNKTIDNKLNSYVTLLFLLDHFVKKEDIYDIDDEDEDYYFDGEDWSESVNGSSGSSKIVDDELSLTSTNPVLNRVITQALSEMLGLEDILQTLREYSIQTKLVAGYGINIEGNVISTTLDINPFVIVESLPRTNINPNKIYLLHSSGNLYILYKFVLINHIYENCEYNDGEWKRVGELNIGIDLSNYLSLRVADSRYQPKGDYITSYELNNLLKLYVRKSKVYTPKLWGEEDEPSDTPEEPIEEPVEEPTLESKIIIDLELDLTSENPVANKVITRALELKQNVLIPGEGIKIENGIISTTFNVELYEFVNFLPPIGEINKIYLMEDDGKYKQYIYNSNNTWKYIGYLSIDLSIYATKDYVSELLSPIVAETTYHSNISDGILTNISVGNISSGTNISTLKGKTFSELFDMLLFTEIWPNADALHTISMTVPSTIVKVGSPVVHPTIVTQWNLNILPISTILNNLTNIFEKYDETMIQIDNLYNYTTAGTHRLILTYSYPSGELTITSNYNNTRNVTIPEDSGTIEKIVKVTYPWYINGVEQSTLVPVGTLYNETITLSGTPVIEIPGDISTCSIKANLGLGFMDVNWNKTITEKDGVPYSVWTKSDSYSLNVEHLIQFTISFDSLLI